LLPVPNAEKSTAKNIFPVLGVALLAALWISLPVHLLPVVPVLPVRVPVVAQVKERPTIKVGARGSNLSRTQTMLVIESLERLNPNLKFEFLPITTSGDDPYSKPIGSQGLKGLFVKEIESALLNRQIDLAVHSAKDLTSELPDGLTLGPCIKRVEPWDVMIFGAKQSLCTLPKEAKIGTSSLRRQAFLKAYRRDLIISPLRGNVETRLKKVGINFSAIVLAKAGLIRLNKELTYPAEDIPQEIMLPSPGQGQLALEHRRDDERLIRILNPLNHQPSALAFEAERSFMHRLGIGCSEPVAALCQIKPNGLLMMKAALVDLRTYNIVQTEQFVTLKDNWANSSFNSVSYSNNPEYSVARNLGLMLAESLLSKAPAWFLAAHKASD
jgi:hydroxymethylbilane synthase